MITNRVENDEVQELFSYENREEFEVKYKINKFLEKMSTQKE